MIVLNKAILHWKLRNFGDSKLEQSNRNLPCRHCGIMFLSYPHYGEYGYTYDSFCSDCQEALNIRGRDDLGYVPAISKYFWSLLRFRLRE